MKKLTSLISFYSVSGFPNDAGPQFYNASPTALIKKKTDVGHTAVGEVFRRLWLNVLFPLQRRKQSKFSVPMNLELP